MTNRGEHKAAKSRAWRSLTAVGLVVATQLRDVVGGLGPAIALCGIASLLAAVFVVPRLPETAERHLDDVSPSGV